MNLLKAIGIKIIRRTFIIRYDIPGPLQEFVLLSTKSVNIEGSTNQIILTWSNKTCFHDCLAYKIYAIVEDFHFNIFFPQQLQLIFLKGDTL